MATTDSFAAPAVLGSFTRVRPLSAPGQGGLNGLGDGLEDGHNGGHGAVFLYRRSEPFVQQVAVRLLPAAAAGQAAHAHAFRSLDHPNIVRLLDVRYTPAGAPCLVMEYVDGVDLAQFCAERQLDRAARLRLLLVVAEAVAFAHSRLTPHGDLRAANILVNAAGEPRLLDFGLAAWFSRPAASALNTGASNTVDAGSIANAGGTTSAGSTTNVGSITSTGSTAADIAALGTMARSLLGATGEPLSPTLDAILAKAAHADAEQRYRSVNELASDLRAALENRPVAAYRHGGVERARLWMRRNPAVGALLLGLALLVVAAAVGISVQTARVLRGRRAAQAELHELVSITGNLERSLYASLPGSAAADPARQALLGHIAGTLDRLRAETAHDPALAAELARQQRSLDHLAERPPSRPASAPATGSR